MKKKNLILTTIALVAGIITSVPTLTVDASVATKKPEDSSYVWWSSTKEAWTTDYGDTNVEWYSNGEVYITGIGSTVMNVSTDNSSYIKYTNRTLTGQHYYSYERSGDIPIGYWEVNLFDNTCIHGAVIRYENSTWRGFTQLQDSLSSFKKGYILANGSGCGSKMYSGWGARCADCGQPINDADMWFAMSKNAVQSINTINSESIYAAICPVDMTVNQGRGIGSHICKAISNNMYMVEYKDNSNGDAVGYMQSSFHTYNNADTYNGKEITPQTHLTKNAFSRVGYIFTGWNTKPDGTGTAYTDEQTILNLSKYDYQYDLDHSSEAVITLYAQWQKIGGTLEIDPNGGTYNNSSSSTTVRVEYADSTTVSNPTSAPTGYTVNFSADGGTVKDYGTSNTISSLTAKQIFDGWITVQPFSGHFMNNVYTYTSTVDGQKDKITASYYMGSIVLPTATKTNNGFGGWYTSPDFSNDSYVGKAGVEYTPTSNNITLYAKFVPLTLSATANVNNSSNNITLGNSTVGTLSGNKGAIDLSWSQDDGNTKTYKLYRSTNGASYSLVSDQNDVSPSFTTITASVTGSQKSITIKYSGTYSLELYGAQGGSYNSTYIGGKGGKVTSTVFLKAGDIVYYTVGGSGNNSTYKGYNGGGSGKTYGGGATSVVIKRGSSTIASFTAGGGGGATSGGSGGAGGNSDSNYLTTSTSDRNGDATYGAGGGGGAKYGKAGINNVHSHSNSCKHTHTSSCKVPTIHVHEYHGDGTNDAIKIYRTDTGAQVGGYQCNCYWNGSLTCNWYEGETIDTGTYIKCGKDETSYYCGYSQGQIISSKPAYGGSNSYTAVDYKTVYAVSSASGQQTGDGYFKMSAIDIEFQSGTSFADLQATDTAAPNKVDASTAVETYVSELQSTISWNTVKDNGTTYYNKVDAYLIGSDGRVQSSSKTTSNITQTKVTVGLAGFIVKVDNTSTVEGITTSTSGAKLQTATNILVDFGTNQFTGNTYKYVHIRAIDRAGNLSDETVVDVTRGPNMKVDSTLYTNQIGIESTDDNIYLKSADDNEYYIRSDGNTPVQLNFSAYTLIARTDFQPQYLVLQEKNESGGTLTYKVPYDTSLGLNKTYDLSTLTPSTKGSTTFDLYSYAVAKRSNGSKNVTITEQLKVGKADSGIVTLIPRAQADCQCNFNKKDIESSIYSDDYNNKITLYLDGKAPTIVMTASQNGSTVDISNKTIDRDANTKLNVKVADKGTNPSGLKSVEIRVYNEDNKTERIYSTDSVENGIQLAINSSGEFETNMNISRTEPLWSGNITITVTATDNVGNVSTQTLDFCELELQATLSKTKVSRYETPTLVIKTYGYAEGVTVTFPSTWTSEDDTLNTTFDYTGKLQTYTETENYVFTVPNNISNGTYDIIVTTYKGDLKITKTVSLEVVGSKNSLNEGLQDRLTSN